MMLSSTREGLPFPLQSRGVKSEFLFMKLVAVKI